MTTRPSTLRRQLHARLGLGHAPSRTNEDWVIALPGIVTGLLAGMVALHVLKWGLSSRAAARLDYALGFVPGRLNNLFDGRPGTTFAEGAGPLISHIFLHGNLPHLLLNAVGLMIFGTAVAHRFHVDSAGARWWNTAIYLAFFLLCGIAGAFLYAVVNNGSAVLLVGASGAISGVMAGALLFALRPFAPYGPGEGALVTPRSTPVMVSTVVYIGINLLTAAGLGGLVGVASNVAWEAHIGGYLFGLFAFPFFDRMVRRKPGGAV